MYAMSIVLLESFLLPLVQTVLYILLAGSQSRADSSGVTPRRILQDRSGAGINEDGASPCRNPAGRIRHRRIPGNLRNMRAMISMKEMKGAPPLWMA